jgi:hypothetical protein
MGGVGALLGRQRAKLAGRAAPALVVLLVLSVLSSAACGRGGGGADRPGVTVPDGDASSASSSSSTTTTAAIDITVKPATVTVAYADAVMDELDRVLSDAIREFVAADGPTKSFDDKLNAVYDEPSLENARSAYGKFAVDGADEFKKPPGEVATTVREVLKSESGCIVLAVERDFGPVFASPRPDSRNSGYVALEPTDGDGDPEHLNRTAWSVVFDGNVLEGEEPRDTC